MANEEIKYTLTLQDFLTAGLQTAHKAAEGLETAMGGVNKVLSIVGLSTGPLEIVEFLKGTVEAYDKSAKASFELEAALRATGHAANVNKEALDAQALSLMNNSLYSEEAITKSQTLLTSFTNVKDKIYMDAIPAIADMAQATGGDLTAATKKVGEALNDPIKGIKELTNSQVSFTQKQQDMITHLAKTGHTAEAQALILDRLKSSYSGTAKEAAESGTGGFTVLAHQFDHVKERIGELVTNGFQLLYPAFQTVIKFAEGAVTVIENVVHWFKEHDKFSRALAIGIGVATGALLLYQIGTEAAAAITFVYNGYLWYQAAYTTAAAAAEGELTIAQWALNVALTANPIGVIVVAIGAFIAAIVYAYEKVSWFHAGIWAIWATLKEFASIVKDVFTGLYHQIHGILTFNKDEFTQGLTQQTSAIMDAGKRLGTAFKKGYEDGMADFNAGNKAGAVAKKEETKDGPKPVADNATKEDTSPKKATGTKSITINISINKLIETFKINTTNLVDGTDKVREMVANTIISAVNDSEIIGAGF